MAKLLLISANLLLVFAIKIFFGGDVTVKQVMQDTIKPGDTLNVTLEITKGDREGFAKWQQTLPEGFIASAVETNGATFSFKNQQIKVIWMELPKTETFTINYQIATSEDVFGEHNLQGRFSYIEGNERKDITSETFILTIDKNAVASVASSNDEVVQENTDATDDATATADNNGDNLAETTTQTEESDVNSSQGEELESASASSTNQESNTIIATENKATVEPKDYPVIETDALDNGTVQIKRSIEYLGDGDYRVTLNIEKGNLESFGKVEEYLPPNFTASADVNTEGIFSLNGNIMKILWMTLPQQSSVEVSYKMKSEGSDLESAVVFGVFSYLNEDKSVQAKMASTTFPNYLEMEEQDAMAEAQAEKEQDLKADLAEQTAPLEDNENTGEPNDPDMADESTTEESTGEVSNEELVEEITNIPSPETSVSYKVQIAASHKEVQQSYFVSRHNISEQVNIEYIDTWYKYTIGSYPVYKQARDRRNQVWSDDNKINDAFVTAYNDGSRITVQEALMISKQKWFK